jgi:hypothetical protein
VTVESAHWQLDRRVVCLNPAQEKRTMSLHGTRDVFDFFIAAFVIVARCMSVVLIHDYSLRAFPAVGNLRPVPRLD